MRRQLKIAGQVVTIDSDGQPWDFELDATYRRFTVAQQDQDVTISAHWHPYPGGSLGEEVFSVKQTPAGYPPNLRMFRHGRGSWGLEVHAQAHPDYRRRIAIFASDFSQGDVYVDLVRQALPVYPYPLASPLDRVLFINLMAGRDGMLLHGCGVAYEGHAYLFVGPSRAGKTTLARMWVECDDVTVLGDETLILRKQDSSYWVYGSPWASEPALCSELGFPLKRIYFIRHGDENGMTEVPVERAMEKLLPRSFLSPYDAVAANQLLDLSLDLVGEVPAFDFQFVPDMSAVRLAREFGRHE